MRRIAIASGVALATLLVVGLWVRSRLERAPTSIVPLRIEHEGGPPHAHPIEVTYVARGGIPGVTRPLVEAPRTPPSTHHVTLQGRIEGNDAVYDLPLEIASVRDEHVSRVEIGSAYVDLWQTDAPTVPGADGVLRLAWSIDDRAAVSARPPSPSGSIHVALDATPAWTVGIDAPDDAYDTDLIGEITDVPSVWMTPDAERGFSFWVSPERDRGCVRAVVVEQHLTDPLRGLVGPARLLVSRAQWDELVASDVRSHGWAGGTPSLSVDPRGSVWLHVSPGGPLGELELDRLVLLVGCFPDGAHRGVIGRLAITVTDEAPAELDDSVRR